MILGKSISEIQTCLYVSANLTSELNQDPRPLPKQTQELAYKMDDRTLLPPGSRSTTQDCNRARATSSSDSDTQDEIEITVTYRYKTAGDQDSNSSTYSAENDTTSTGYALTEASHYTHSIKSHPSSHCPAHDFCCDKPHASSTDCPAH